MAGGGSGGSSIWSQFVVGILFVLIFGFFFIRNRKKNKNNPKIKREGIPPQKKLTIGIIIFVVGIVSIIIAAIFPSDGSAQKEEERYFLYIPGFIILIVGAINIAVNIGRITKQNKVIPEIKDNTDQFDKLEKLAKLKDQGVITEEEFIEQKRKILN